MDSTGVIGIFGALLFAFGYAARKNRVTQNSPAARLILNLVAWACFALFGALILVVIVRVIVA